MQENSTTELTYFKKPNFLVSAKYKSTVTENRLISLCLSRIGQAKKDAVGNMICTLTEKEIRQALGVKRSGSIYERLKQTCENMTGRVIGISNPETESFAFAALITNAKFESGELTIEFNKSITPYLESITEKFTTLNLEQLLKFDSVYAFRLYEILLSKAYHTRWDKDKSDVYVITIDLYELTLMMGAVNSNLQEVRSALSGKNPDYERAVEKSPERVNTDWRNFSRSIKRAIEEINEKSEIKVSFKPIKRGHGNKVKEIEFTVLKESKKKAALTEEQKTAVYDAIFTMINEKITYSEALKIAEAAEYDLDTISNAYAALKEYEQKKEVPNPVGYLIRACQGRWTSSQREPAVTQFGTFAQHDYDFEELERQLLNAQNFGNL